MSSPYTSFSIRKWILGSSLGWLLSIVAILLLSGLFDAIGIEGAQFYLGLGIGMGLGLTQWRRLRRSIPVSAAWLWLSIAGMGMPFLLFDLLKLYGGPDLGSNYIIYCACLAGINTGLLQSFVLRKFSTRSSLWIAGNVIALIAATGTVLLIDQAKGMIANNWVAFFLNLFLILAGGPVYGIISAWFMVRVLKGTTRPLPH